VKRREFIAGLGGAAAWPLAARAQQRPVPAIGWLSARNSEEEGNNAALFRQGLSESGYVEGQNVAIEYRWADAQYDQLPVMADDLVRRRVAIIIVTGNLAAQAAKSATTNIPIVFSVAVDPVKVGLVASLNRPEGNLTGVTDQMNDLGQKRLELLHKLVPNVGTIAVLMNPDNPNTVSNTRDFQAASEVLGVRLLILHSRSRSEIEAAFATSIEQRAGALLVGVDPFLSFIARDEIIALAANHRIPAIGGLREYASTGGLMSYGSNAGETPRLIGVYAARILKGEKPADLPVMLPTKFEFVINLKTARSLGIDVPPTLLAIADEVIE
jgi:putative tryptophan/tyrosine transport system substrate-binding protein